MAKRRDLSSLPELPQGLTLSEVAGRMTRELGVRVTSQDVYAHVVKPAKVELGRARRTITRTHEEEVQVISERHMDTVRELVANGLGRKAG